MTNNNDITRLITFLENQIAAREATIASHREFLHHELQTPNNAGYDFPVLRKEIEEGAAYVRGLNLALQEAKAIAEGH